MRLMHGFLFFFSLMLEVFFPCWLLKKGVCGVLCIYFSPKSFVLFLCRIIPSVLVAFEQKEAALVGRQFSKSCTSPSIVIIKVAFHFFSLKVGQMKLIRANGFLNTLMPFLLLFL